jgi:hypothetical protein
MTDLFSGEAPEVRFEDLVGEGKKFRDPDAVAKKVIHADQHIERLEREQAELRAELAARQTVEDMLNKLQKPAPSEVPVTPRQEPGAKEEVNLSAEVQRLLQEERAKESRQKNIEAARKGLKDRFGPDYNQRLEKIAEEMSISKDFLTSIASTSPDGFFKLIDSVAKPDDNRPTTPPTPSHDPLKMQQGVGRKNNAYYQNLRKENPSLYFSRKVQNEMHSEVMKQGASFYS